MTKIWEEWLATKMGEGHVGRLIRRPSGPFGFIRVDGHNLGRIVPETCPVRWDKVPRKGLRLERHFESTEETGTTHATHHGFVWTISEHAGRWKERKQGLNRGNFAPDGVQRRLLNSLASPGQAHTGLPVQEHYYESYNFISAQRWVESRNHLRKGQGLSRISHLGSAHNVKKIASLFSVPQFTMEFLGGFTVDFPLPQIRILVTLSQSEAGTCSTSGYLLWLCFLAPTFSYVAAIIHVRSKLRDCEPSQWYSPT